MIEIFVSILYILFLLFFTVFLKNVHCIYSRYKIKTNFKTFKEHAR